MSVILKNTQPPLLEVAKLGGKESQVYCFLWQSAVMDVRYDKDLTKEWKDRRDCGGTTHWSIKGIADQLSSQRKTISKALCSLLDAGLIVAENYITNGNGSQHTIFRVVHPNEIENVRAAISVMGSPSERWTKRMTATKQCKVSTDCSDLFADIPLPDYSESDRFGAYYPDRNGCISQDHSIYHSESYEDSLDHRVELASQGFL